MNSKKRCTFCREYFNSEDMLRGGLNGVCSEECLRGLVAKARSKRERRKEHKEKRVRYGRRLPGAVRDHVRTRDNHICRWCGVGENLNIHHVRYRSEGGPDRTENLITLCMTCHAEAHTDKKKYQPVLLLALWYDHEHEQHWTVGEVFKLAEEDVLEAARKFSDQVMAGTHRHDRLGR